MSEGTPETNIGRPSSGQKYTSSLGHGLCQQTSRAVLAGMPTACSNRARLMGVLRLGGVEVYSLWIWLGRHGSAAGDIDMDS